MSPLWLCHLTLSGRLSPRVPATVRSLWDLRLPAPSAYRVAGAGPKSQLVLDAGVRAFEEGLDAGVCWEVVRKRLVGYTPVHPLLSSLSERSWPSREQQLCGQICASRFQVRDGPEPRRWVTPATDLSMCLDRKAPAEPALGRNTFDRLRIPWNGISGWRTPNAAQVCSFNLVAQNFLPGGETGFLPGGVSPVQWAGETASGSRIAGGSDGLASAAITGMQRYGAGSGWSTARCSNVAIQCFSGLLLEIMGEDRTERYEWVPRWSETVDRLSRERPTVLAKSHPWCAPLQPYLSAEQEMAQFDAPCRNGVEEARASVLQAAKILAAGDRGEEL